ncbi:MAG: BNR-4 repeat-containing protein [Limisphaerales bacterium]
MNRRDFSKLAVGAAVISPAALQATAKKPHLLSSVGCGRATGYAETNKIVSIGDRTHVSWLDSPKEGFRVRVATLDRNTGDWSPTYTLGGAHDNHGGPALTCDSEGYLHTVYFTHHHPFRYRRSKRPNDASEWEEEIQFGDKLTYPTLVCGADDTLYLTARRSDKNPWWVEMWEKKPGQDWSMVGPVVHSRHKGYAHFQESLCWGPDHKSLHLCCRFHELTTSRDDYGRLQTVAYMKSDDFGRTWKRSDGSTIEGPITVDNVEVIAKGGEAIKQTLRAGCLAVSPTNEPFLVYSVTAQNKSQTFLATTGSRGWERENLNDHLPAKWRSYNLLMSGGVAFDGNGVLHGVAQLQTAPQHEKIWGDPTNEIVAFEKRADSVKFREVSAFDDQIPHWLPNIERPTGHNRVKGRPGIIYTGGSPGVKNTDRISNRVYWVG